MAHHHLILTLLTIISLTIPTQSADMITKMCLLTKNTAQCNKILRSSPAGDLANTRELEQVALKFTLLAAKNTKRFMDEKNAKDPNPDHDMKVVLVICGLNYGVVFDNIDQANANLASGRYYEAMANVDNVKFVTDQCKGVVELEPRLKYLLALNERVRQFVEIAVAVFKVWFS